MAEDASPATNELEQPTASATGAAPPATVRLQVATVAKLNLADFQNAVPALRELAVVNDTETALGNLVLTVSSEPAFLQPRTWHLDTVDAGANSRTELTFAL